MPGSEPPPEPSPEPSDVTRILAAIGEGDRHASDELLPLVYTELRRLAASMMAKESPGQTLQPTALVHDAYLRLIGPQPPDPNSSEISWSSRAHFFGAAAIAMRRILVDRARARKRLKRGGGRKRIELSKLEEAGGPGVAAFDENAIDFIALDDALRRMEQQDSRMAQVVMLRFFAGLSIEDTARAMDLSPMTIKREWSCARAWLLDELSESA